MSDVCKRFVLAGAFAFAAAIVTHAQWLNYKTPGIPRTADGKPRLDAPAPQSVDGHPDLSGVWMHELTSVAEMRRLYGATIEEAIKVARKTHFKETSGGDRHAAQIWAERPARFQARGLADSPRSDGSDATPTSYRSSGCVYRWRRPRLSRRRSPVGADQDRADTTRDHRHV